MNVCDVDSYGETRESSIRENVIKRGKRLFLFILPISHTRFMIKKYGGVMTGLLLIMESFLTLREAFLNSLKSLCKQLQYLVSLMQKAKIASLLTILLIIITVTLFLELDGPRIPFILQELHDEKI